MNFGIHQPLWLMDEWFIDVFVLLSVRDLQRLGELQTELAGAADFCATYLRCQLLLMKVGVCECVWVTFVYYAYVSCFSMSCSF